MSLNYVQCNNHFCVAKVALLPDLSILIEVSVSATDVRLVGGQTNRDGQVQFRVGDDWQSVCSTTFGPDEAEAVCRHAGLGRAVAIYKGAQFGANTAEPHPPICCTDTSNITDCIIPDVSSTCESGEAAGVVCSGAGTCELHA